MIQFLPLFLTATARFLLFLYALIIGKSFSHTYNLKYVSPINIIIKLSTQHFSSPLWVFKIIIIRWKIFLFLSFVKCLNSAFSWFNCMHSPSQKNTEKSPILVLRKQKFDYWMELGVSVFQSFLVLFDIQYNFRSVILSENFSAEVENVYLFIYLL